MMKLMIVTPEKHVIGPIPVADVVVPASKGEITVLPGHAKLLSTLSTGVVSFARENGKREYAAVSAGFVEVNSDRVVLLAETLELAQQIDVERAKKAQKLAEEKLSAKENFEEDMQKWERKYQRALIRQQAAEFLLPQ